MLCKPSLPVIAAVIPLLLCSCVSSRHWFNDAVGGEEIRERMARAKTPDEKEYWKMVNESRPNAVLLIEDSLDREIKECEEKGYRDCNPR